MKKKAKAKAKVKGTARGKGRAKAKGKAKSSRKRSAVKGPAAKKASSVRGGLPAVQLQSGGNTASGGMLLPAVEKVADGSG
jgi:hypothetical protein